MKTIDELRKIDYKKLSEELEEAKKELFKVKFDVINGQSKNAHIIGKKRKYIARIKTLLIERKSEEEQKVNKPEEESKKNPKKSK